MMIAAAAARRQLTLVAVNLWQTGVRSLFKYYQYKHRLTQDEAWANIRLAMEEFVADQTFRDPEEWEYQEIRAILYEEENITLQAASEMNDRWGENTPLIDSIKTCLSKPVRT